MPSDARGASMCVVTSEAQGTTERLRGTQAGSRLSTSNCQLPTPKGLTLLGLCGPHYGCHDLHELGAFVDDRIMGRAENVHGPQDAQAKIRLLELPQDDLLLCE